MIRVRRALRRMTIKPRRWADARRMTYRAMLPIPARLHLAFPSPTQAEGRGKADLRRYIEAIPVEELRPLAEQIAGLAGNAIRHRFDLLGSGWVQVKHGMACRGLEGYCYEMGKVVAADPGGEWLKGRINRANEAEARRIWGLIGPGYTPIDWQIDFKSGYRWAEDWWYQDIPYGHLPGVDIKVPWELARMQHLPQLAWAYALAAAGEPGFEPPEAYTREFRAQVLDFIATNPPRFGVNWAGAMDVAIRIVNWLITYDIFWAYGAVFDAAFEQELIRSAIQHGQHILANRDWYAAWRGNHYLAEMAGLFVVGMYLGEGKRKENFTAKDAKSAKERKVKARTKKAVFSAENAESAEERGVVDCGRTPHPGGTAKSVPFPFPSPIKLERGYPMGRWVAVARRELDREVGLQFHADGSHFEASTSYHRLAAELIVYAAALALTLPPGNFPQGHSERIEKMGEFTQHSMKPSGRVVQIGDNDSGRFLKLFPTYERLTVEEACARYANLDGYETDEAIYWDEDVLDHSHLLKALNGLFGRDDWLVGPETLIVRSLAGGRQLPSYRRDGARSAAEGMRIGDDWAGQIERVRNLPYHRLEVPIRAQQAAPLQGFGYPDFGLYVFRSERVYVAVRCGAIGYNGAHAHNDQLAVELTIDGRDVWVDPGTYVYTPLPERRNEYRSGRAHYAPQIAGDQEPGRLDGDLFRLDDTARAECLYFGPEGFSGVHHGYGFPVYRVVTVGADRIVIEDGADQPLVEGRVKLSVSPKYGSQYR